MSCILILHKVACIFDIIIILIFFSPYDSQSTISSSSNHVPASRIKSPFPDDSGYTSLGHNQYHAGHTGYQGGRVLPAQHYGALGYPNAYPTRGVLAQENHQQGLDDMTLDDTQNLLQEQLQQIWHRRH